MKFKELDTIIINTNAYSSSHGIKKGRGGTIVEIYNKGEAYEIEFVARGGRTDALITVMPDEIKPTKGK